MRGNLYPPHLHEDQCERSKISDQLEEKMCGHISPPSRLFAGYSPRSERTVRCGEASPPKSDFQFQVDLLILPTTRKLGCPTRANYRSGFLAIASDSNQFSREKLEEIASPRIPIWSEAKPDEE